MNMIEVTLKTHVRANTQGGITMIEVALKTPVRVGPNAVVRVHTDPKSFSFGPVTLQINQPLDWAVLEYTIGVNSQLAYEKRNVLVPATGILATDYHDVCKAGQVLCVTVRYVGDDPDGGLFSAIARGPQC